MSMQANSERRARFARCGPLAGVLWLMFAPIAGGQTSPAAEFEAIRARLLSSAEAALREAGIRRASAALDSRREELPRERWEPGPWALEGASLGAVTQARRRLELLGVDAARVFAEEGVPLELLLVAKVESAYNPLALSPKGARGTWQLMPETARAAGLEVREGSDDRLHPERSTRAAARHLRRLFERFGDWPLALAAYNAGEGRVAWAMERSGARDFQTLVRSGHLPRETQAFVPAVIGALRGEAPQKLRQ